MDELKNYLNSLSTEEQNEFAKQCNTSIAYLRKAISMKVRLGAELCVLIEVNSNNKVTRKDLINDWETRWPELINANI